jgi:hypothetical protein
LESAYPRVFLDRLLVSADDELVRCAQPVLLMGQESKHSHHVVGCYNGSPVTPVMEVVFLRPEAEIAYGPACWLWDYLRRSRLVNVQYCSGTC